MLLILWVHRNVSVQMRREMRRRGALVLFDLEKLSCSCLPHNEIILVMKCFLPDSRHLIGETTPERLTGLNYYIRQLSPPAYSHLAATSLEFIRLSFSAEVNHRFYSNLQTPMNM